MLCLITQLFISWEGRRVTVPKSRWLWGEGCDDMECRAGEQLIPVGTERRRRSPREPHEEVVGGEDSQGWGPLFEIEGGRATGKQGCLKCGERWVWHEREGLRSDQGMLPAWLLPRSEHFRQMCVCSANLSLPPAVSQLRYLRCHLFVDPLSAIIISR